MDGVSSMDDWTKHAFAATGRHRKAAGIKPIEESEFKKSKKKLNKCG